MENGDVARVREPFHLLELLNRNWDTTLVVSNDDEKTYAVRYSLSDTCDKILNIQTNHPLMTLIEYDCAVIEITRLSSELRYNEYEDRYLVDVKMSIDSVTEPAPSMETTCALARLLEHLIGYLYEWRFTLYKPTDSHLAIVFKHEGRGSRFLQMVIRSKSAQ